MASVRPSHANTSSAIIGIGYTPAVCFVCSGQRNPVSWPVRNARVN